MDIGYVLVARRRDDGALIAVIWLHGLLHLSQNRSGIYSFSCFVSGSVFNELSVELAFSAFSSAVRASFIATIEVWWAAVADGCR
ncbi:hypothetical protein ACIPO9_17570 [Pseudomonas sp. NPDC090203]|uniref:hypothetical protein n=1 Tax=Pseudomonas sp. NPDC090203 TaxID=3364477 RepID=UPI00380CF599